MELKQTAELSTNRTIDLLKEQVDDFIVPEEESNYAREETKIAGEIIVATEALRPEWSCSCSIQTDGS